MSNRKNRDEFVRIMTQEAPALPLHSVRLLMRHAATLHRLAEQECNGDAWHSGRLVSCPMTLKPWEPGGYCPYCGTLPVTGHSRVSADYLRAEQVQRRVQTILHGSGVVPVFSGDPRGAVLKLKVQSGRTNDWGQTGICVP